MEMEMEMEIETSDFYNNASTNHLFLISILIYGRKK
jgi:hypothetical protein